jgi:hypothetical protein
VTSRDIERYLEGRIILETIDVPPRPLWVRGPATIDGDEIVLNGNTAERYAAFDPEHATRLLFDLGNLAKLGEIDEGTKTLRDAKIVDKQRAQGFAETHGLLWHGPQQVGRGEVRESLHDWFIHGLYLTFGTGTYSAIRLSQDEDSAEPVRSYLRTLRDVGWFHRLSFPDDDNGLLEWASIQLAELISRGMADCTPTFSTACVLKRNGEEVRGIREFKFGNDPGTLVGAANYHLASLVSRKKLVRHCEECSEMFVPDDPRQRYHPKCGARKRQRE